VKIGKVFILILLAAVFVSPFYVSIVYSLKDAAETARAPLSWPENPNTDNYRRAVEVSNFFRALRNSALVTVASVLLLVVLCSSAAWPLARNRRKLFQFFYYLFIATIILPFQVVMFPLYSQLRALSLLNSLTGLVLAISGFQLGFTIFLYTGFVRSVPFEMEEAAKIDGCSRLKTFTLVVFPLLKPVTLTVIILSALAAWNDFAISLVLVQREHVRTLPLTQYYFFGQYNIEINMAFAAFTLSMIPIVLFYLVLQKYIEAGVTAGALKG
jgi:raffinose/stachyose/melibiose transport system permease protein